MTNILKKRQEKQQRIDEMQLQAQAMQGQLQQAMSAGENDINGMQGAEMQNDVINQIDDIQGQADGLQGAVLNEFNR